MKTKRIIKDQKGGALIEFAILLPLLVLFFAGVIELGLLFYNKQVIVNASREGARAGIIAYDSDPPPAGYYFSTNQDINDIIENYCTNHLITFENPQDDVTITLNPGDRTASSFAFETPFTVTVKYDYHFLLPSFLGLGASKWISGMTTMLKQQSLE